MSSSSSQSPTAVSNGPPQAEAEVSVVVKTPSKNQKDSPIRVSDEGSDEIYQGATPKMKGSGGDQIHDTSSDVSEIEAPENDGNSVNGIEAHHEEEKSTPLSPQEPKENNQDTIDTKTAPTNENDETAVKHNLRTRNVARNRRMALVADGTGKAQTKRRKKQSDGPKTIPKNNAIQNLPSDQYETTLVRRAIRKRSDPTTSSDTTKVAADDSAEENSLLIYGDVSLGMQLAPIGGKIIVQGLIPLQDGCASPAQLAGCIRRGDVLLQINHKSLVNIPFDQLMLSLKPLSTPLPDGSFPRTINLRFASQQGLDLLRKEGENDNKKAATGKSAEGCSSLGAKQEPPHTRKSSKELDGAADILGLFTMVDQLSGMPMFPHEEIPTPAKENHEKAFETTAEGRVSIDIQQSNAMSPLVSTNQQTEYLPLEDAISMFVANERRDEREACDSEFFSWNESLTLLLRRPPEARDENGNDSNDTETNPSSVPDSDFGHDALRGARKLSAIMEKIDRGWSDKRSIRSLSATLSFYSRASTRRRYVLDSKAMPVNFEQLEEEKSEDENESDAESGVGSDEGDEELGGDELLLQLAADDEVWKQQVIEFLEDVVEKLKNPTDVNQDESTTPDQDRAAAAVSSELGSFLFGDRMTKALMLHKKPQALPPDEITALLFDLTTNVSATVPNQIQAVGTTGSIVQSSAVPIIAMKKPSETSNVLRAARFLLDRVLPVWLRTFKPLPWEQRRLLWPLEKNHNSESMNTVASSRSDDSMTLDSFGTRQTSPSMTARKKNLREQIEEQELDAATRSEACFLTTFYFTNKILPQLLHGSTTDMESRSRTKFNEEAFKRAKAFIRDYGAYIRLHTCIAQAAMLHAQDIIKMLLSLAKNDPLHRESMRRFSKASNLHFYEPGTLSAVVQRLQDLHEESNSDQRSVTIHLCASAYPDVRPWQVDRECRGFWKGGSNARGKDADLHNLYYKYLTLLLHPTEGSEAAKFDSVLVLEWTELSVRGCRELTKHRKFTDANEHKKNFFSVASTASSDHLLYARDLASLLSLSMELEEFVLALDLVNEILEEASKAKRQSVCGSIISALRKVGCSAVDLFLCGDSRSHRTLIRTFRLLQRASQMERHESWVVDIPFELGMLIVHAKKKSGSEQSQKLMEMLKFFAREAPPKDFLVSLHNWVREESNLSSDFYPILQTALRRGSQEAESVVELSNSLQIVKQARLGKESHTDCHTDDHANISQSGSLWKQMSRGLLPIAK